MGIRYKALAVLLLLTLLLALSLAPAFAYWPDWLERLLQLFTRHPPTPTPTPTPALPPAYVITTPEEGLKLLRELPKGKVVRVVLREGDVNRYLARYAGKYEELHNASVGFEEEGVIIRISADSEWLREEGWWPFPGGRTVEIEAKVEVQARGCRPLVRLLSFRVNGQRAFWRELIARTANAYLQREWRRMPFCVKEIHITDDSLIITGYKSR